jgi:hypothetical protein
VTQKIPLGVGKARHTCCRLVVPWWVVGSLVLSWVLLEFVFGLFLFWGLGVVGFCKLALVVPMFTFCVFRGALRFL